MGQSTLGQLFYDKEFADVCLILFVLNYIIKGNVSKLHPGIGSDILSLVQGDPAYPSSVAVSINLLVNYIKRIGFNF